MSPAAADLVAFASVNMPDDDTALNGGAIDLKRRCDFTVMAANDTITAISDNAGDTQNLTIEARSASGAVVSETKALTGVTGIDFSTLGTVERILKAELASDAVGSITVERGTAAAPGDDIRIIPPTERGFLRMFRKSASESAAESRYEKFFWKNTHGTEALNAAHVDQSADPTAKFSHLIAAAKDDSATSANRKTVPNVADTLDPDVFDDTDKNVPGTDLLAGEAIGTWVEQALLADDAAFKDTYTSELEGTSV